MTVQNVIGDLLYFEGKIDWEKVFNINTIVMETLSILTDRENMSNINKIVMETHF